MMELKIYYGKLLHETLRDNFADLDPKLHKDYLEQYEKICVLYNDIQDEPVLKIRWARYFWGQFYKLHNNLVQAEVEFLKALTTDAPAETLCQLSDARIKCGLLEVYYANNNSDETSQLLCELMRLINHGCEHGLNLGEVLNVYSICNTFYNLDWGNEYLDQLKKNLLKIRQDIVQNKSEIEKYYEFLANFVFTSILTITESGYASKQDYEFYVEIIEKFSEIFSLNVNHQVLMYRTLMRVACELDISEGIYVAECVKRVESSEIPVAVKAEIFQAAASFYFGLGKYKSGQKYLNLAMEMITREWRSHVKDFDKRAYQILDSMQCHFLGCYDVIHKYLNRESAYEKVLQFKALASLAGRERNRILFSARINRQLVEKIQEFQNKIAYLKVEEIFRNRTRDSIDDAIELGNLEGDFAREFPQDISFVNIILRKVQEAIPDNSIVIEYFVFEKEHEKHEFTQSFQKTVIDIYVTRKEKGDCTLNRHSVQEGKNVLEESREFMKAFFNPEEASKKRKEVLRRDLYRELVKPILPFIDGIKELYIAPDRDLINLPFEILSDKNGVQFGDNYNIVRIECARDFLFNCEEHMYGEGSLIIGNPRFKVNYDTDKPQISQLPFSGVEAQLVSSYYDGKYYSGDRASKFLLLSAKGYRNIHIATHGCFKPNDNSESVYSACLLLAGVENWLESGKADEIYGNGIVTADEISRMDLRSVELVVLSTCWSSRNIILEDKGFHGLIGAFSQAGVHYVISHLWEAADFGSALLMSYFYYQYAILHQTPPVALNIAKQFLRKATIGDLRKGGWFDLILRCDIDERGKDLVRKYEAYPDCICPFKDEKYWGGFSCYRCN